MNKANYIELRNTLKEMREELKVVKPEYKSAQKALSTCQKEFGSWNALYKELESLHITKKEFDERTQILSKFSTIICHKLNEKESLQDEYRHLHIVYSLARGRTMEQIEPKVREGNEPNLSQITALKERYGFDDVDDRIFKKQLEKIIA